MTRADHPESPQFDRRAFIAAATTLAATTAMAPDAFARNFGPGAEPVRYPDPDVIALDKRFKAKLGNAPIQRLYTGTLSAEGPAWHAVARSLRWSHIPNSAALRWIHEAAHFSRPCPAPPRPNHPQT